MVCSCPICSLLIWGVKPGLWAYQQKGGVFSSLILMRYRFEKDQGLSGFPWIVVTGGMGCWAGGGIILV